MIRENNLSISNINIKGQNNDKITLYSYINQILQKSFEGETLALIVAALYQLLYCTEDYQVDIHPVNQCGASSKEVSDIDIYCEKKLIGSNELKDKTYNETDIRHAADKVITSGGTNMLLIEGFRGNCNSPNVEAIIEEYLSKGLVIEIIPITSFSKIILSFVSESDTSWFIKYMLQIALDTKFKKSTIDYILETNEKMFNIKN